MLIEVSNLNLNLTESDVRRLFVPFGEVGDVSIFRDGRNNRSRGKAQVDMPVLKQALQAMTTLQGKIVAGKLIYLLEVLPPFGSNVL